MNSHERFEELAALAMSGTLTSREVTELHAHLELCRECRREHQEFLLLTREGMPMLAAGYAGDRTANGELGLDEEADSNLALGRISEAVMSRAAAARRPVPRYRSIAAHPLLSALAASLLLATALGIYRFAGQRQPGGLIVAPLAPAKTIAAEQQNTSEINRTLTSELNAQAERIAGLLRERSRMRAGMEQLQANLNANVKEEARRTSQVTASLQLAGDANATLAQQLAAVSTERDDLNARLQTLSAQFHSTQAEAQNAIAEVKRLTAERDQANLRMASLQSQREDLLARNEDQQRRLGQAEEYLARDQDIRELMGARQLYMADVFDVLGNSQTRNPYGRIFYTKERSLIFYAFDLDRQQGAQKASFQAWGRTESSQMPPVNLGILYQDNQQNRRWVLRFDDARQLSRIDSIFVTIEPQGGSQKPTGKRFLYASLRREPNHP